jgi:hypothetical protein
MAVPFLAPFSAGQILTSDDMNETAEAVNSLGLFIIKSQTIGTAVSSVTVTGAFSSDFDHYKIIVQANSIAAGGPYMTLQMGSTTTGYYWGAGTIVYTTGTANNITTNNGTSWDRLGPGGTAGMSGVYELLNPFKNENTLITGSYADPSTAGAAGAGSGFLNNTTSYTAFTVGVTSSTMTGGTVRVYGYRNSYS